MDHDGVRTRCGLWQGNYLGSGSGNIIHVEGGVVSRFSNHTPIDSFEGAFLACHVVAVGCRVGQCAARCQQVKVHVVTRNIPGHFDDKTCHPERVATHTGIAIIDVATDGDVLLWREAGFRSSGVVTIAIAVGVQVPSFEHNLGVLLIN